MILFSFVLFTGIIAVATYLLTRGDDHGSSDGYFLAGTSFDRSNHSWIASANKPFY